MKKKLLGRASSVAVGDTRHIKYIFVDVVGFSSDRSVEAQNDIVETLNDACIQTFEDLIPGGEVIYIPTGDGICVAILDAKAKYDAHLIFALGLLSRLDAYNEKVGSAGGVTNHMRQILLRVGISENVDNIVRDINGNKNVAGIGVTIAQRIMSLGDGMQVLLSAAAYQTLHAHEKYMYQFQKFKAVVKHGQALDIYQFRKADTVGLNTDVPSVFRNREPIEDQCDTCLRETLSISAQVRCVREATDSWESEIQNRLDELTKRLPEEQRPVLAKAQRAWSRYRKAELDFSDAFHSKMRGSMWRPIRTERHHHVLHERGRDLGTYLESVSEQHITEA